MATFFGEILSVHSRAVEEDEEDENEEDEDILEELDQKRLACRYSDNGLAGASMMSPKLSLSKSASVDALFAGGLMWPRCPVWAIPHWAPVDPSCTVQHMEVHLEWYPSSNLMQCTNLIIAVGSNAASFLSVYVLTSESWEAVGHASLCNAGNQNICGQTSTEPACVFYRNKDIPAVIICKISGYIEEDQQFQWTEKVFGCFQQNGLSVTVLSDSPVAEYKNVDFASSSSTPFLLCLQTNSSTINPPCPLLEQPNIFTGIPAAVLSHCQVNQIPTVAYQCYSDAISPDSVTMETYKLAFTSVGDIKSFLRRFLRRPYVRFINVFLSR
ncbi:Proteasome assembly chaperone 1 [Merluccius polli]|uniref:Proteasome assembly chaperone 1 n=1 Tax=Merluccius polli TaxID=89951 RepID=A0AA47MZ82_MERPO|nr:Proteasome assembly chaperone 1 [Merluccius polli]